MGCCLSTQGRLWRHMALTQGQAAFSHAGPTEQPASRAWRRLAALSFQKALWWVEYAGGLVPAGQEARAE